jgi:dTDP-4-dehydrorhamnose reductase
MKILLFGKTGQVGWELQRSLAPLGELVALDSASREMCGDFSDPAELARTVRKVAPDVIVNAAAYTAVDKAESEAELARTVNALAPGALAEEAMRANSLLVHYSTDYVFDGGGDQPWRETDATAPLNVYGATKLEGEQLIQQSGCRHLILRTSWVYGARGGNFIRTMLKLAQERDSLNVIDDQVGAPTGADLLADVTAHAIRAAQQRPEVAGLYHLVAGGEVSWHGYARFVIDYAARSGVDIKVAPDAINAVPTSAFPTPARRPHNSRMDTAKLKNTFGLYLPDWRVGVARMLSEVLEKN